jgi:preprotein translocase subunit SecD
MFDYPKWKYWIIALVVLVSGFYALPNAFLPIPAVQVAVDRTGVVDATLKGTVEGVLKGNKISYQAVEQLPDRILVRFANVNDQLKGSDALRADATTKSFAITLNLAPSSPKWMAKFGAKAMALGLDLQGGVHFLMELDQKTVRSSLDKAMQSAMYSLFREKSINYTDVSIEGGKIVANFVSSDDTKKARIELDRVYSSTMLMESQTDKSIVMSYLPNTISERSAAAVETNITTMRNRFGALVEPIIQRQGEGRIVIELPGVQDTKRAREIIGATASLEYRAVDNDNNPRAQELFESGAAPGDSEIFDDRNGLKVVLKKAMIASGGEIIRASSGIDSQDGTPNVSVTLNPAAGDRMLEFTTKNVGKPMAVVYTESVPSTQTVDGKEVTTFTTTQKVISVARVKQVFGRNFQTTGLAPTEARDLAVSLNAGSLAAPMKFAQQRVIGPSLGVKNIIAGLLAVTASFLFVLIFFGIYYKGFGLITGVALIVNLLMVVAIMSLLGSTLTLPGLAGLALTVGMSVDANVLINERIREELRRGMSPLHAIDVGYEKASGTIWDANVTALLGGVALLAFGSGPIRGFAITLCLGIITSIYTAVSLSKGVAALIYGGRKITKLAI